jgi:hypothetical protein
MRDALGNKISEGSLLFLKQWGLVGKVIRVVEGGLSIGDEIMAPGLTIQIDLPLQAEGLPSGQEPQVAGVVCVVNPQSEMVVERLLRN